MGGCGAQYLTTTLTLTMFEAVSGHNTEGWGQMGAGLQAV